MSRGKYTDLENLIEIFNRSDWDEMHVKVDDLEIFLSNDPGARPPTDAAATPPTAVAAAAPGESATMPGRSAGGGDGAGWHGRRQGPESRHVLSCVQARRTAVCRGRPNGRREFRDLSHRGDEAVYAGEGRRGGNRPEPLPWRMLRWSSLTRSSASSSRSGRLESRAHRACPGSQSRRNRRAGDPCGACAGYRDGIGLFRGRSRQPAGADRPTNVVVGPAQLRSELSRPCADGPRSTADRCDALHPGYGFLAERPELAQLCADNDVRFVGPRADTIEALGDKLRARGLAEHAGVPLSPGTDAVTDCAKAQRRLPSWVTRWS